ncbi:uncharacterized protein N7482_003550 [Penicillium canariense]|uniref:Uncharacterized protein n=1 Tax=Penicillium canariense TaxID=189055 RepID=A0A9W9I6M4_9EURO|nr:uncharacterized protein N7482_003550 [Penicillium canariense]KAJ5167956.1 hypothetical protein N7482_003550 [Penicillium canariense]
MEYGILGENQEKWQAGRSCFMWFKGRQAGAAGDLSVPPVPLTQPDDCLPRVEGLSGLGAGGVETARALLQSEAECPAAPPEAVRGLTDLILSGQRCEDGLCATLRLEGLEGTGYNKRPAATGFHPTANTRSPTGVIEGNEGDATADTDTIHVGILSDVGLPETNEMPPLNMKATTHVLASQKIPCLRCWSATPFWRDPRMVLNLAVLPSSLMAQDRKYGIMTQTKLSADKFVVGYLHFGRNDYLGFAQAAKWLCGYTHLLQKRGSIMHLQVANPQDNLSLDCLEINKYNPAGSAKKRIIIIQDSYPTCS